MASVESDSLSTQPSTTASQPSEEILRLLFNTECRHKPKDAHKSTRTSKGKLWYTCKYCDDVATSHIGNARYHAKSFHANLWEEHAAEYAPSQSTQNTSSQMSPFIESYVYRTPSVAALRNAFNREAYQDAITSLLTRRRLPFSAAEYDEMAAMCLACNPAIGDLLTTSRRIAMRQIVSKYEVSVQHIADKLSLAKSQIHIQTDLWTSPNRHALLAICAQWVDEEYQIRKALLAMPECPDTHSGEAQAELIMEVLNRFGITRIGYHTGDNATSNDTCLQSLAKLLPDENDVRSNISSVDTY